MLDVSSLVGRRDFMKLMGASLAMASTACTRKPLEAIVPYATEPERMVIGEPTFFATALTQGGYAQGVLVESNMGRPTKVEGNPGHPASLGATGPIEQGRILELWDPERSRAPLYRSEIASWDAFTRALLDQLGRLPKGGAGLRILSRASSSPTFLEQWSAVRQRYPQARLHQHEPIGRDNALNGTRWLFNRPLEPIYHFERARIVVSLDADFMGKLPGWVRYAHDFMSRRRPDQAAAMNRLYVAECMPSLTGAAADHRLPTRSGDIGRLATQLWAALNESSAKGNPSWLTAVTTDLLAHRGESLVLVGDGQPAAVHALAHRINQQLGNWGSTVDFIASPVAIDPQPGSLEELVRDMTGGHVEILLILGGNPIYEAPADLDLEAALRQVPTTVHWGLHVDETAKHCVWHVPATHELESWGDSRAFDGTVTLQQPLIAPLYGGRGVHELMALLLGDLDKSSHDAVRDTWSKRFPPSTFNNLWQQSLRTGLVPGTQTPHESVDALRAALHTESSSSEPRERDNSIELAFQADSSLWDGRYANVAWLQELPKAFTQLTWDNAAILSPALATQLNVTKEDVIEIEVAGRKVEAPVWIVPGHADGSITLHLGSGRTDAGSVGSHRGVSAYAIRPSNALWFVDGVRVRKVGRRYPLATVQYHHRMEGRDIVRSTSLTQYLSRPDALRKEADQRAPSLYPGFRYDGYAWGMSIDLGACIGCNACTIACQAENNIPTVGKDEVLNHREMHWIRVDRYEEGDPAAPRSHFQPVPCMQCEQAPCEVVCPVEASVHDSEGINVQVYNRCVGTRFCSNNCPYKVRRFNFLAYTPDEPSLNARRNPEVTVRMRGVMEKCNYCLQRIVRGRITADREDRRLHDGEVVTACQAVCPTQAIVFGDLNDERSQVRTAKSSPRSYGLLGELNTRPRTTYLAKITNPAPEKS